MKGAGIGTGATISNLLITREILSSVKYKEIYGKQLISYSYCHRAQIYSRSRNNSNLKKRIRVRKKKE